MRVDVNGDRLFFDVEGAKLVPDGPVMREKPTLVLVHGGFGSDHSSYKPQFSQLADVAQLIYVDLRGGGRSDWSEPGRWSMEQWADDLRALCDALEIEGPIVYGQSLGGMVVQAYATRYPEHPSKLILCSTFAKQRFDRCRAVFERLGGPVAAEIAERYFAAPGPDTKPDFERVCRPLYYRTDAARSRLPNVRSRILANPQVGAYLPSFGKFDFLPALSRVACPTLIIGGEDDPACPIEDQEDIAAALPAAHVRFERFANAGHCVWMDDPRFFEVLREFIS